MAIERGSETEWPHWPGRASGGEQRERLERRLLGASAPEVELRQARASIVRLEAVAAEQAERIEQLERASGAAVEPEPTADGHLLFAPTPRGYVLLEREGRPPAHGGEVGLDGGRDYVVARIGPSPLPGDDRPCAYLVTA